MLATRAVDALNLTYSTVAKLFNVHEDTIGRWFRARLSGGLAALARQVRGRLPGDQIVAGGIVGKGSTDAVNGEQLYTATQKTAFASKVASNALAKSGGTMSGDINMGHRSITNLADPVNAGDAVNKGYVDGVAVGLKTSINQAFKEIDKTNGGVAIAMAMGGLTMPDNKNFAVNASFGFFQEQTAFAVQTAVRVDPNWVVNGALGFATEGGQIGGRLGLTAAW